MGTSANCQPASQEELRKWKDTFRLVARGGDSVTTDRLGTMIRSLGFHPTETEIDDAIKAVDPNKKGIINADTFIKLMEERRFATFDEQEIRDAFLAFDTD